MPAQMRLNASDERFFSPDRDLAYCSPHLIQRAIRGLDPDNQEPWVVEYLTKAGISTDDLCVAAGTIATYMNTLRDPLNKEPLNALEAAGFFALKPEVRIIVCAKLGQVFLSAVFPSIRDITRDATEPAMNAKEIAEEAGLISDKITKRNSHSWLVKKLHSLGKWVYSCFR